LESNLKKIAIVLFLIFQLCEAQIYRTYIPDVPISIILLKRDKEIRQTKYENGAIESECQYSNNRLDGVCKEFYDNGILRSLVLFKNGRENGIAYFYYETGILRMKIEYKRGKAEEITNYDTNGKRMPSKPE
jgi:antitoxin component YwqK of YwqJK toxin-antitoxin module